MDNQITTPEASENPGPSPISSSDRPEGKKHLLFEIVFVAVFLAVFFGILNYFNIINLSGMSPNLFGFLPHRSSPSQQSQQLNNVTIVPTASPSGQGDLSSQAKQALISLLPTIITPSFAPKSSSNITIFQGRTPKDESRASWKAQDGNESARFVSSVNGNQIIQLYILFDLNSNASVSTDLAKKTVSKFFLLTSKEPFSCKLLSSKANYCESFWEEPNGTKRGIGMHEYSPFSSGTNKTTVFFCQFMQESPSYSWKSCAEEFAETGVQ